IPFPWFDRFSENPQVKAFVGGVTAAASGAIAGACFVLARRAIVDVPTLLVGLVALGIICPWLITRFVDPAPEFLFVPPGEVMAVAAREHATPFDVAAVELGHRGP